jgi:hypothetical protein
VSLLSSDLLKAGLKAAVQVVGGVVTTNPLGLIQVGGSMPLWGLGGLGELERRLGAVHAQQLG